MDKREIRKSMEEKRAGLAREQVLEYSDDIWSKIYGMESFKSATAVLLYSSIGNEVNTVEIANKALTMGKQVAYPVTNTASMTMEFYAVSDLSELMLVKSGSFSLMEPRPDQSAKIIPDSRTLMIVPGLAFDKQGYRTGYGGGFYDKYITKHTILTTIGVCYDFQVVERIPAQSYDRPVGVLVTNR